MSADAKRNDARRAAARAAALKAVATRRARLAGVKVPDLAAHPVTNGLRDAVRASWPTAPSSFVFGALEEGRWGINPDDPTQAWGRCAKCGADRPAHALKLTQTPFKDASYDVWACGDREVCRA